MAKCPSLQIPVNGYFDQPITESSFRLGETVSFGCDDDYEFGQGIATSLLCQDDGTWSATVPICMSKYKSGRGGGGIPACKGIRVCRSTGSLLEKFLQRSRLSMLTLKIRTCAIIDTLFYASWRTGLILKWSWIHRTHEVFTGINSQFTSFLLYTGKCLNVQCRRGAKCLTNPTSNKPECICMMPDEACVVNGLSPNVPVCANNAKTYQSACHLEIDACLLKGNNTYPVMVREGPCLNRKLIFRFTSTDYVWRVFLLQWGVCDEG